VAVVDANWAGKSTLLLQHNGLLEPAPGEVCIGDVAISGRTRSQVKRTVGLVLQDADAQRFIPTVFEDMVVGPLNLGLAPGEARARVLSALETPGCAQMVERASNLRSGGWKRAVEIADVLAMAPSILVLSASSAGPDPAARRRLIALLSSFRHIRIVATHDLDLVLAHADDAPRRAARRRRTAPHRRGHRAARTLQALQGCGRVRDRATIVRHGQ
jgi:cobalt/nickel transport system ATP-binding protein